MSELEKPENTGTKPTGPDTITGLDTQTENELRSVQSGLRERIRKLLNNVHQGGAGRQELAKDRTRSLALLIGGTVGAALLFIGLFSTPAAPRPQTSGRAAPNLGRATLPSPPSVSRSSVTPLLIADLGADDASSGQLSPADIEDTSRRTSTDDSSHSRDTTDIRVPHGRTPPGKNFDGTGSFSNAGSDPLVPYRLNNGTGTPTYRYGEPVVAGGELSGRYAPAVAVPMRAENPSNASTSGKSSIMFLRSSDSGGAARETRPAVDSPFEETSLLPPGTSLAARLEAAATTALKTPVVASIDYNYERDGTIMVPAGSKVFGDIQQATSEGYLHIRFHTLRMADGREEKIEGTGVSLDHQPLKGQVSGKNTGKKLLSQTLSGIGTVAAYVVGAGGIGLSRTVTGDTLLRDRLASNVALAGEQELTNATYAPSVSVTVPANTRFYVVLQKPAVTTTPNRIAEPAAQSVERPTVEELRELMDLRREINRMYQESNNTLSQGTKP